MSGMELDLVASSGSHIALDLNLVVACPLGLLLDQRISLPQMSVVNC